MAIDLSNYTIKDLEGLKKDLDKEIRSRRKQEEKRAREELKKVAESYGFSLNELVGGAGAKSKGQGKNGAKFVHPDDSSKTWSGRGRKPQWIKEWEEKGRSLEDLRAS